jgi:indolepyruvate ferredoxin oxidoreductase
VITIGQIVAVAAHIEGKGASVLDMSGLAQKGGPVMSHVRSLRTRRSCMRRARHRRRDLVIGCDLVVTASTEALRR